MIYNQFQIKKNSVYAKQKCCGQLSDVFLALSCQYQSTLLKLLSTQAIIKEILCTHCLEIEQACECNQLWPVPSGSVIAVNSAVSNFRYLVNFDKPSYPYNLFVSNFNFLLILRLFAIDSVLSAAFPVCLFFHVLIDTIGVLSLCLQNYMNCSWNFVVLCGPDQVSNFVPSLIKFPSFDWFRLWFHWLCSYPCSCL